MVNAPLNVDSLATSLHTRRLASASIRSLHVWNITISSKKAHQTSAIRITEIFSIQVQRMFMIPGSEFDRLNSLAPWTRYMPSPYPLGGLQAISSFFIFNLL